MSLCAPNSAVSVARTSLVSVLSKLAPDGHERRRGRRSPFGYRLLLTPLDGEAASPEPIVVTGRDLSPRGVGFQHARQLAHRRVRLVAADPVLTDLGFAELEIEVLLRWCRFVAPGVYESGGRVTGAAWPLG